MFFVCGYGGVGTDADVWVRSYLDDIDRITAKMYFPTDGERRPSLLPLLLWLTRGGCRRRAEGTAEDDGRRRAQVHALEEQRVPRGRVGHLRRRRRTGPAALLDTIL